MDSPRTLASHFHANCLPDSLHSPLGPAASQLPSEQNLCFLWRHVQLNCPPRALLFLLLIQLLTPGPTAPAATSFSGFLAVVSFLPCNWKLFVNSTLVIC